MVHVMSEVKPAHHYRAQTLFSFGGAKIEYFPHGPEVVLASEYDAQRLRADTAEAELDEQKRLRASSEGSNAAWLMTVGLAETMLENPAYELTGVDWDYEHSIHDKVRAKNAQLAAAEQRIADTVAKLELAVEMLDDDERGIRFAQVLRLAIAALNPSPEAEIHE